MLSDLKFDNRQLKGLRLINVNRQGTNKIMHTFMYYYSIHTSVELRVGISAFILL